MADSQTPCADEDLEIDRQVAQRLRAFIRTESGSAGALVVAALIALVWANSPWSSSYEALWHKTVMVAFGSSGISMDLHAAELDLDVEQFLRDLEDERLAEHIRRDVLSADASGVRGTPTFFVGDQRVLGPHDARSLIQELETSLRRP
ncbi:MAG: Na+/H+ antiporter NhaA [Nocardioides sp.]|nr:Na+/H+ antiporter NhaA [Nocardioides sp.]